MTNQEINNKIAKELLGWSFPKNSETWKHILVGIPPVKNYSQAVPNFAESLDECMKHLVPALKKKSDAFVRMLTPERKNDPNIANIVNGRAIFPQGEGKTLSMAFCNAVLNYLEFLEKK